MQDRWQLVLANISIQGWVIDSKQHGFPDGPSHALVHPAHYAEIVQRNFMASDVEVSCTGDGALKCSLNLLANVLPDSPIYSSAQSTLPHLYL